VQTPLARPQAAVRLSKRSEQCYTQQKEDEKVELHR